MEAKWFRNKKSRLVWEIADEALQERLARDLEYEEAQPPVPKESPAKEPPKK